MLPYKIIRSACIFLFLAGAAGGILRLMPLFSIPSLNSYYVLQAHSHTAFLGWAFLVVLAFLTAEEGLGTLKFNTTFFYSVLITTIGVFFSFFFSGYSALSVFFLAVHTILTCVCAIRFFRRSRSDSMFTYTSYRSFLRLGLAFHLVSTLGVLLLGPVIAIFGKHSVEYDHAIYLYLHFQYNGFLLFSVLGLVCRQLALDKWMILPDKMRKAFFFLALSVLFTLYLSFLRAWPRPVYFLVGGIGALLQIIGFVYFFSAIVKNGKIRLASFLYAALVCLLLKCFLQLGSAIPIFSDIIFANRWFVIFYLHLVLLGVITFTFMFLVLRYLNLHLKMLHVIILLFSFVAMQALIFLHGTLPGHGETILPLLAVCSVIFIGAIGILAGRIVFY